jgi:hypothetical protein
MKEMYYNNVDVCFGHNERIERWSTASLTTNNK